MKKYEEKETEKSINKEEEKKNSADEKDSNENDIAKAQDKYSNFLKYHTESEQALL